MYIFKTCFLITIIFFCINSCEFNYSGKAPSAQCSFKLSENKTVRALFQNTALRTPNSTDLSNKQFMLELPIDQKMNTSYLLNIEVSGLGTLHSNINGIIFNPGTTSHFVTQPTVILIANPETNYILTTSLSKCPDSIWIYDDTSQKYTCTIFGNNTTLTATAVFEPISNVRQLTVVPTVGGKVTSKSTLNAQNPMSCDRTTFEICELLATLQPQNEIKCGSNSFDLCTLLYPNGTFITLTTVSDNDYEFVEWEGC